MRSDAILWSLAAFASAVSAQRCSIKYGECPGQLCCSQYGWCGASDAYCGKGCQGELGSCGSNVQGSLPGYNTPTGYGDRTDKHPIHGYEQPKHGDYDDHYQGKHGHHKDEPDKHYPHLEPPHPSPSKHYSKPGTVTHRLTSSTRKSSTHKTSTHKASSHRSSSTTLVSFPSSSILSSTSSTLSSSPTESSSTESSTTSDAPSSSSSVEPSITPSSTESPSSSTEQSSTLSTTSSAIPSTPCTTVANNGPFFDGNGNSQTTCEYTPPDATLGYQETLYTDENLLVEPCANFCVNTPGCMTFVLRVQPSINKARCSLYASAYHNNYYDCSNPGAFHVTVYGASCVANGPTNVTE